MTRATIGFAISALLLVGAYPGTLVQGEAEPIRTTVCRISADPARFSGKRVVVTAQYKSDGIERVILVDPDCEEVGITPRTPKHYTGEADLAKALSVGRPGTLDKIIKGTFVGKFRWSPQENQKFILVLGQVRDLSSMMK